MSINKTIIFGINDLAELAWYYLYYLTNENKTDIPVAFTVNKEYLTQDTFHDLPVIPFEELEQHYSPSEYNLFAPIANNVLREKIYNEGKQKGYKFISYISSKCTNFAKSIGENCFILEDNTLQPFTTIGNNVVLWSGNHIGHHSIIEDNSTLRDGITIGENSIIGMGSVVTKNVPNNETWIGSPAKKK